MDEAEKYQQRLQAIAERRRLQEEQEKAKRELEDERLRLQQLKRKSLRDQWLMEGPPLSPSSPDGQSPRSPLWGSQAQELEKRIDKLETESERLAEEEEKLKEQIEDEQMEALKAAEAAAEAFQEATSLPNGEEGPTVSGSVEEVVNGLEETAPELTNGSAEEEGDVCPGVLEVGLPPSINGPTEPGDGPVTMTFLGFTEAEPGQGMDIGVDEEDEGTLVIRAERVIITDEGEVRPDILAPQEEEEVEKEGVVEEEQGEASPELSETPNNEMEMVMVMVEEEVKTEVVPETPTESAEEKLNDADVSPDTFAETGTGETDVDVTTEEHAEEVGTVEEEEKLETPPSVEVQPSDETPDGARVASVPVYSEAQSSPLSPSSGAEALVEEEGVQCEEEAVPIPENQEQGGVDEALGAELTNSLPGQFQEVSLADPQEDQEVQRTEGEPGEQEPLLSQSKAPPTKEEPAAVGTPTPANAETPTPTRVAQGDEAGVPKRKTCQCCSVM